MGRECNALALEPRELSVSVGESTLLITCMIPKTILSQLHCIYVRLVRKPFSSTGTKILEDTATSIS